MPKKALWWFTSALTADALIFGADLAAGKQTANMIGLLLIGPLIASQRLTFRPTFAVVVYAVALGFLSAAAHQVLGTLDFAIRFTVLLLGSAFALYSTWQRTTWTRTLTHVAEVAKVAQRAIMRPIAPQIGATAVAVSYRTATAHTLIGGDLYDLANTVFGVRILIGDVRGKGLEAIRLTAAAIGFFRDLAYTEADLTRLVRQLDAYLAPELGEEDFITLVAAELSPGEVRMVNCGHCPPLLITETLTALTPPEPSPPVGLCPTPRLQHVPLAAGDRLLFYTDGLIEARNHHGDFFTIDAELRAALTTRPLPQALQRVEERLEQHTGGVLRDDVALVLVTLSTPTTEATGTLQPRLWGADPTDDGPVWARQA